MEVRCPACTRQLNVAQAPPGATLQCPYCGGMFQLAAPQPQHAAAGMYAPAGGMGGYASPPVAPQPPVFAPQETFRPAAAARRTVARRQKSGVGMQIGIGVVLVAVVIGVIFAGISLYQKETTRDVVPATAVDPVVQKTHELVLQEAQLPEGTKFDLAEDRIKELAGNKYQLSGIVNLPSRLAGTVLGQKWVAQVAQLPNGHWELERLEVDGQSIVPRGNQSEARSRYASGWLTQGDNSPARYSSSEPLAPKVDHNTRWAVERVADNIRESAKLRKTLVVWLLDRSPSARSQQKDVLGSLDTILKDMKGGEDPQLSMAVVSFSSEVAFPLETPSGNAEEVQQALNSVEEDTGGREHPFTAIQQAAQKYGSFRTEKSGYVIFVVLSDEMGDDDGQLDQAVELIKQQQIVVYTIGVSAPLGLSVAEGQKGLEAGANDGPTMVRQGPESRNSEMIRLASLGGGSVEVDSGFGPFSLSRLCHESGGRYLACKDYGVATASGMMTGWGGDGSGPMFDPAKMSKYAPDYVSDQAYQQILASNKACMALNEAAKLPFATVLTTASTRFPKNDEASFKRSLDAAQREAAKHEQPLIRLVDTLKKGESDRAKLTRPRWQAGFDLAMGRALAARVRTEGYNQMLAKIKTGGNFTKPGANTWVLVESDTIGAGSTFEKMLSQSREYLQRVVKDHPGTPWAWLADRELQTAAGWQWQEE